MEAGDHGSCIAGTFVSYVLGLKLRPYLVVLLSFCIVRNNPSDVVSKWQRIKSLYAKLLVDGVEGCVDEVDPIQARPHLGYTLLCHEYESR